MFGLVADRHRGEGVAEDRGQARAEIGRGKEERVRNNQDDLGVQAGNRIARGLVGIVVVNFRGVEEQLGLPARVSLLDRRVMVMWEKHGDRHSRAVSHA